jgi:hypothetical protein
MEKLIHQYLDENYFPYKEGSDYYRIYHNDNQLEILFEIQPYEIVRDLKEIYLLEIEEIKLFTYTWAVKIYPDIDLSKYWSSLGHLYTTAGIGNYSHVEGFLLPIARQAMTSTIGLDLVSIQPMTAPKGILFYMDYQYDKKQSIKQKLNSVLDKIKIFIRKMEKDIRKYLHITNYNATFVTQEK